MIRAYAASAVKSEFKPFEYDPGPLGAEDVEIAVQACGICHSDLSMLNNEWGMTRYPFVPGHEIIGTVQSVGSNVTRVKVGQNVGVGWTAKSCMTCTECRGGDHNLCAKAQGVIVGRHGGFADTVRAHWAWTLPLPAGLDPLVTGPLLCGGITVFNPLMQFDVRPVHRVGVVGIGGLGHMALLFLNKWGCEVTAFTSEDKKTEALKLGAHHTVNSREPKSFAKLAGSFDFILVTVNVPMDWVALLNCLKPKGRLHFVGAVLKPLELAAMPLIMGQKSVSGSPTGSPVMIETMLDFCARHKIAPVTEQFPMSQVNDAMARLDSGKARYRIVLTNDFK